MSESKKLAPPEQSTAFHVRIHFRQNASWQGTVQWLDGKKTVTFRSVLELAKLMAETLGGDYAAAGAASWDKKEEVS